MKQHQNVINPLPWSVSALVLLMIVPEVYILGADLRLWGSATARFDLLRAFALFPEALGFALRTGYYDPSLVMRLFSFSFVHGHWLSALVSVALVLAMGKFVAQVLGNITMLLIFFATSFLGALIYSLVAGAPQLLFGGTVGFYGLIGAFTLVQFIDAKRAFCTHNLWLFVCWLFCWYSIFWSRLFMGKRRYGLPNLAPHLRG